MSKGIQPLAEVRSEADEELGARVAAAFKLLGNETRVRIILTLWEAERWAYRDTWGDEGDPGVPFTALRKRIGIGDSGRFNYHLSKLVGSFVGETPDGYRLLPAGRAIGRLVEESGALEDGRDPSSDDDAPIVGVGDPAP